MPNTHGICIRSKHSTNLPCKHASKYLLKIVTYIHTIYSPGDTHNLYGYDMIINKIHSFRYHIMCNNKSACG